MLIARRPREPGDDACASVSRMHAISGQCDWRAELVGFRQLSRTMATSFLHGLVLTAERLVMPGGATGARCTAWAWPGMLLNKFKKNHTRWANVPTAAWSLAPGSVDRAGSAPSGSDKASGSAAAV